MLDRSFSSLTLTQLSLSTLSLTRGHHLTKPVNRSPRSTPSFAGRQSCSTLLSVSLHHSGSRAGAETVSPALSICRDSSFDAPGLRSRSNSVAPGLRRRSTPPGLRRTFGSSRTPLHFASAPSLFASPWQFGYNSCFISNHLLVYLRLILGFTGQFLCSYSTLPLYALVTQMGTNYKAALIPNRIRETIHGWGKAARRKRRHGFYDDSATIHTETSTVMSIEDDPQFLDDPTNDTNTCTEIELQQPASSPPGPVANETSSRVGTPLLRPCASVSPSTAYSLQIDGLSRCSSLPARKE